MARRALNNPRQRPSKLCGCKRCLTEFPGERKPRRDCIGSWQARYRDADGKQRHKNFRTKREADAFLDSVRSAVREGTYLDPTRGDITVEAWWKLWWKSQENKGQTTTRNRKLSGWNAHIKPKWGRRKLNSLGYLELQEWMTNEVKGYATQTKVLELLRAMLRDAVRDQRIKYNPAVDVQKTAKAPAKHPEDLKPPTEEQYEAVRQQLPSYYRPLVDFAQDTGMRWGEYTGLRRCHVDLPGALVYVREVVIDDHGRLRRQAMPKSAAGLRVVPLTPKALAAVQAMIDRLDPAATQSKVEDGMCPDELVFRGPLAGTERMNPGSGEREPLDGVMSRNNFRRVWIKAIKGAGIARMVTNPETGRKEWWPRVHDYRHAIASRLHAAGIPEVDVQLFLGQERGGRVTWLYTHGSDDSALASVRSALLTGRALHVVSKPA
ncbi:tyrosine-type recombinase/integrase [Streptomyces sp. NPDC088733]|uniref:tyrosine-type recombinase/integrase n=1 Tax=Streptomyces sp. NPDC088733 TaxID=3365880 RepID=UPI0037F9A268